MTLLQWLKVQPKFATTFVRKFPVPKSKEHMLHPHKNGAMQLKKKSILAAASL